VATTESQEKSVIGLASCLPGDIECIRKLAQHLDLGLEAALELLIELQDARSPYDCLALSLSKVELFPAFLRSHSVCLQKRTIFETQVHTLLSPRLSNSWHTLRVSSRQGPAMTITHMVCVHSLGSSPHCSASLGSKCSHWARRRWAHLSSSKPGMLS
jgi:hypothetical protein